MQCDKCKKEITDNSKFCSNCGAELKEKQAPLEIEDVVKKASQVWFILGYIRAIDKDDKKAIEESESKIKNQGEYLWNWYQEVIDYWKEWVKTNDEKNKKTNGSKRVCVPEAKGNKKK